MPLVNCPTQWNSLGVSTCVYVKLHAHFRPFEPISNNIIIIITRNKKRNKWSQLFSVHSIINYVIDKRRKTTTSKRKQIILMLGEAFCCDGGINYRLNSSTPATLWISDCHWKPWLPVIFYSAPWIHLNKKNISVHNLEMSRLYSVDITYFLDSRFRYGVMFVIMLCIFSLIILSSTIHSTGTSPCNQT